MTTIVALVVTIETVIFLLLGDLFFAAGGILIEKKEGGEAIGAFVIGLRIQIIAIAVILLGAYLLVKGGCV